MAPSIAWVFGNDIPNGEIGVVEMMGKDVEEVVEDVAKCCCSSYDNCAKACRKAKHRQNGTQLAWYEKVLMSTLAS